MRARCKPFPFSLLTVSIKTALWDSYGRVCAASSIGPGTGKTVELGTIGPDVDIGPKQSV